MDIERFVDKQLHLIEIERRSEIEQSVELRARLPAAELERRGLCLLRLRVDAVSSGLGGRSLLRLVPSTDVGIPATRIQPGDIVSLGTQTARKQDAGLTGVVFRMSGTRVQVALDKDLLDKDSDELPEGLLRIDRVANDVTYRRMRDALHDLRSAKKGPARRLREILFGQRDPGEVEVPGELADADFLNASQREAVLFALSAPDIGLIHGPPGTGKTTAVVDLICRAVERKERVLACAPSNVAVDNMAERLAIRQQRIVRLGHPARLLPGVVAHSLDALVDASEGSKLVRDVRRDLERAQRRRAKARSREDRRDARNEIRALRSELGDLEKRTVRDIISSADVVLATTTGCADAHLRNFDFDLVVIDEAAQALECSCWIALLKARRAVLAGDHLQLPPTVVSREAEKSGLGVTLFDRLTNLYGDRVMRMLKVQYRMNECIMNWSSDALYGGALEAHESVRSHVLAGLDHVDPVSETTSPLVFIDTAGCDFDESTDAEGESRSNDGEADIVARHLEALFNSGVRPEEIAVITPYNAQVQLLRARLRSTYASLEIDTVDGFQGREKEAVILSLVRSNSTGEVGFLADRRRLNVAVTRARRHVAIVGDSATIANDRFLAQMLTYIEDHGEYRSAWEYR